MHEYIWTTFKTWLIVTTLTLMLIIPVVSFIETCKQKMEKGQFIFCTTFRMPGTLCKGLTTIIFVMHVIKECLLKFNLGCKPLLLSTQQFLFPLSFLWDWLNKKLIYLVVDMGILAYVFDVFTQLFLWLNNNKKKKKEKLTGWVILCA